MPVGEGVLPRAEQDGRLQDCGNAWIWTGVLVTQADTCKNPSAGRFSSVHFAVIIPQWRYTNTCYEYFVEGEFGYPIYCITGKSPPLSERRKLRTNQRGWAICPQSQGHRAERAGSEPTTPRVRMGAEVAVRRRGRGASLW